MLSYVNFRKIYYHSGKCGGINRYRGGSNLLSENNTNPGIQYREPDHKWIITVLGNLPKGVTTICLSSYYYTACDV